MEDEMKQEREPTTTADGLIDLPWCVLKADKALTHYIATDKPSSLVDLLTDLMHWADANGYNFDGDLASATLNYKMEKLEERDSRIDFLRDKIEGRDINPYPGDDPLLNERAELKKLEAQQRTRETK